MNTSSAPAHLFHLSHPTACAAAMALASFLVLTLGPSLALADEPADLPASLQRDTPFAAREFVPQFGLIQLVAMRGGNVAADLFF